MALAKDAESEWLSALEVLALGSLAAPGSLSPLGDAIDAEGKPYRERPIVAVVRKPGAAVTREELLKFFEGKTAKWQIPDDVVFVEAIPLGATGKMLKTKLREQLAGYKLPGL